MKYLIIICFIVISCQNSVDKKSSLNIQKKNIDYTVALNFIDEYRESYYSPHSDGFKWIAENKLLTQDFINRHKAILDSALIADPEFGLKIDPITNEKLIDFNGYKIKEIDSLNDYVTLQGKSNRKPEIILKVVSQNGFSLVNGAGIINIPKSKIREQ
jgi:hypothetical protein